MVAIFVPSHACHLPSGRLRADHVSNYSVDLFTTKLVMGIEYYHEEVKARKQMLEAYA